MKADDITAGVILRVPAGADLIRNQTYYCRVDTVEAFGSSGYAHLMVTRMRADGRMTRRWHRSELRYRVVTSYVVVDIEKITEHQPTGEIR